MKIAGVCTAYHEASVLPWTVEHLLAEGVDHVWVEVPEGDHETVAAMRGVEGCTITAKHEEFHDQPGSITRMAGQAAACFGEELWIIPFDADEFWFATSPTENIRTALEGVKPDVGVLKVGMFQQRDWHWREVPFKPMPKVAYRYHPAAKIRPGNHSIEDVPGKLSYSLLTIREIQYQNFEHFCRKVEERNRTLDPNAEPKQGVHMTRLADASESKLAVEWEKLIAEPVIWDPIPSLIRPPEHLAPPVEKLPINQLFELMKDTPTDICGHMERLRELATGKHVLEIGVNTGMSTIAFTAGRPKTLQSVDIDTPRWRPEVSKTDFWQGDSLDFPGSGPWDVVFIDTDHTMRQTVLELTKYAPKVAPGGCLVLHDTESCPQVALAIQHFLHVLREQDREPTKIETYSHSMGLTVIWLP
jgi:hypothetical protein